MKWLQKPGPVRYRTADFRFDVGEVCIDGTTRFRAIYKPKPGDARPVSSITDTPEAARDEAEEWAGVNL